ncbi:hypothetical protein LCGC14_1343410 [marine sediment metagenome]|uniref:Rubredoxin-like domain-containing protein n=1 Tax=marine sediment metagenome TaxID=412755 RepID=A0A0F9NFD9_9ZZZZ
MNEDIYGLDVADTCKWRKNGFHFEDHDYYETGCDNMFQFNDAGPEENHFKFCPYCGSLIEMVE